MKLVVMLALLLYMGQLFPASSEKIGKECATHAAWAGEIFDLITANPEVLLNGMDKMDENNFLFIRKWIAAGKPRDELLSYVWSQCPGTT